MSEKRKPAQSSFFKIDVGEPPQEIIEAQGKVHPHTTLWLMGLHQSNNLDSYLDGLERAKLAETMQDVIDFTSRNVELALARPLPVPRVESPASASKYLKGIRRIVYSTEIETEEDKVEHEIMIFGVHGTTSHYAVRDLMRGLLPRGALVTNGNGEYFSKQRTYILDDPDPPMTPREMQAQIELKGVRTNLEPIEDFSDEISGGYISDKLLSYLKEQRDKAHQALRERDRWSAYRTVEPLYAGLLPIFGDYAKRLKALPGDRAQEVLLPTFLNWVNATLRYYRPDYPRIIFPELPVLDKNSEAKSGRVDGLEVISKNGRDFTESERKILSRMSQDRYSSVARAIRKIESAMGEPCTYKLDEFKFDVGDHVSRNRIIDPSAIANGPVPKDLAQLKNYIVFSVVAEAGLDPTRLRDSWPTTSRFTEGADLIYFMHRDVDPTEFHFEMSPEEQREAFQEQHTRRVSSAREKELRVMMDNLNLGQVLFALNGKRPRQLAYENGKKPEGSQLAFVQGDVGQLIRELAESSREFVDRFGGVVEVLGDKANGKKKLQMNYSELLQRINSGDIEVDLFNPSTGGMIECIMEGHKEKTPSMKVYLDTGTFKCFGCGCQGRIDYASMPLDLVVNARRRSMERELNIFGEVEIPQELYAIMNATQEILADSFMHNPQAQDYVIQERGIDPETAIKYGVGFFDERAVVQGLLDRGFDLKLLEKYGLLRNSKNSGRMYSIMRDRITFPLSDGENLVNNIYGRATKIPSLDEPKKAKRFKHRKLATQKPHGLFNSQVIKDPAFDEIIVVEGCLDALSLIEMDYENVVAIVGKGNYYGIAQIARAGKDIALALDNDAEGQMAMEVIEETLKANGFTGRVRNFTTDFVDRVPEAGQYDDYNSYWQAVKSGKIK